MSKSGNFPKKTAANFDILMYNKLYVLKILLIMFLDNIKTVDFQS